MRWPVSFLIATYRRSLAHYEFFSITMRSQSAFGLRRIGKKTYATSTNARPRSAHNGDASTPIINLHLGHCYLKKLYYPALFWVGLDYILSLRQPTSSRWTAHPLLIRGAWLRISHFLSCINPDFTIPRVITCAPNYITIFGWLRLL
nr:hypothetical protein [Morchella crassipes]